MSRFRLHTKAGKKLLLSYLMAGTACAIAAGVLGYMVHSVGITRAKSRETVLIYTEEELEQYLVDTESEEYNLNGRYRLEENLDLSWMEYSIGTNLEPFTGKFDGNGHVISGLERPLFGVIKTAEIENLFFDDLTITRPFTYSDGERYVDGYGALTAYAVDSTIRNCGMSGGLYMASPSEAEYQLAKASPSEANENRGPGMPSPDIDAGQEAGQESRVETSFDEENTGSIAGPGGDTEVDKTEAATEIGPGVESTNEVGDNENSKPSENPGDQEKDQENDLENGKETVTSSVGNISSSTNEETDAIKQEPSKSTNGEIESTEVIAETTNGTAESLEETTDTTRETKDSTVETKDTTVETKDSTGETTGSTATAATEEPTRTVTQLPAQGSADHGTKTVTEDISETAIEGTVPSETIGFRLNQRQSLMMKAPTAADFNIGELLEASPSDATPSDAQEMTDESCAEDRSREETEYIGNPGGDLYILVTAERVTAGGLAAQTAGDTLISESFAMVTIAADLEEIETYSGGLAGILGTGSRTENCYAVGLSDSTGTNGGFAAVNEGEIKNSYAVVTIGNAGTRRGAFTALERGSLTGCVYDRQIACAGEENTEFAELASPAEAIEFHLIGMKTSDMTGTESMIPGNWRKTEHAYPQLEYFSLHEDESAAANSKASVIALELPGELTLADVIKNGDIILPLEIDGEEIVWEAEGNIRIDEKHQVVSDDGNAVPTMEANDIPTVGSTLNAENAVTPETKPVEDNRDIGKKSDNSAPQLKAFVGNATRNFAITEVAVTATTYSDWVKVGEAVEKHEISGISPPVQNSEGYYEIENAEQLGWFASKVNNGETGLNAKITADIDLTGGNYGGTIDVPLEWVPMADNNGYSGTFDGGGYVIDYLSVNLEVGRAGLFAEVNGAVIKNVQIGSHSSIITGSNAAGGIVSTVSDEKSMITDCINHAAVTTGDDHVGGIVGSVKDAGMVEISRCGNTGKISTSNGDFREGLLAGSAVIQQKVLRLLIVLMLDLL